MGWLQLYSDCTPKSKFSSRRLRARRSEPDSSSSVGAGSLMRVRAWPRSLPRRQRLSRALSAVAGGPVAELLLPRVHTALSRDIGATPGQRLVVSVSGGCDSVALLHLLLALQPRWRLRLHVLHFNHGLRPESGDEEAFVHALAERHSLPVHVRRLPAGWRESQPGGIQERSREWRRAESLALLDELDAAGPPQSSSADADFADEPGAASLVALAHHADDQAGAAVLGGGTRRVSVTCLGVGRRRRCS